MIEKEFVSHYTAWEVINGDETSIIFHFVVWMKAVFRKKMCANRLRGFVGINAVRNVLRGVRC